MTTLEMFMPKDFMDKASTSKASKLNPDAPVFVPSLATKVESVAAAAGEAAGAEAQAGESSSDLLTSSPNSSNTSMNNSDRDDSPSPIVTPEPEAAQAVADGIGEFVEVGYFGDTIAQLWCQQPAPHFASAIAQEQMSRILMVTHVPSYAKEHLNTELQAWGPLRYFEVVSEQAGFLEVIVHFFDLRHAQQAVNDIQTKHVMQQHLIGSKFRLEHVRNAAQDAEQQAAAANANNSVVYGVSSGYLEQLVAEDQALCAMVNRAEEDLHTGPGTICGSAAWAQFMVLSNIVGTLSADMANQGTLVVFNISEDVTAEQLLEVFSRHGDVREIRESPVKRTHKFIEFFDTRDASNALKALDGTELAGNKLKIEFSRPGGTNRKAPRQVENIAAYYYPPNWEQYQPLVEHSLAKSHMKFNEEWFQFREEGDDRTTLMVRNIPNKYSQRLFMRKLDEHCRKENASNPAEPSAYDFVYMPMDAMHKCNLGYAFVNFTTLAATLRFYKAFNEQHWEEQSSRKVCGINYARIQGVTNLELHFKGSKISELSEGKIELQPRIFRPPRDGSEITR